MNVVEKTKIPDAQKCSFMIGIYMTEQDYELMRLKAFEAHKALSAYGRDLILKEMYKEAKQNESTPK